MDKILIARKADLDTTDLSSELKYSGYNVIEDELSNIDDNLYKESSAIILLANSRDLAVISNIRKINLLIPIIVISNSNSVQDKIYAFDIGADDYIVEPYDEHEVVARVKAHIRKTAYLSQKEKDESSPVAVIYSDDDYETGIIGNSKVYFDRLIIKRGNEEIYLTNKEAAILQLLYKHRGKVVSREMLINEVWNGDTFITARVIDTNVVAIRKKLGDLGRKPKYIKTIFGVGYKLVEEN